MAKRAAPDEQPYRPLLNPGLAAALAKPVPQTSIPSDASAHRLITKPAVEPVQRIPEVVKPSIVEFISSGSTSSEPKPTPSAVPPKFDHEKRILFTRSESEALDRLVTSLARRLNAQVKVSHVVRALVALTLHAEGEVDKRAGEAPNLTRPPNGDAHALQRFEREIAQIIGSALRDAPPLRS